MRFQGGVGAARRTAIAGPSLSGVCPETQHASISAAHRPLLARHRTRSFVDCQVGKTVQAIAIASAFFDEGPLLVWLAAAPFRLSCRSDIHSATTRS